MTDASPSLQYFEKQGLTMQKLRKINSINKSLECGSSFTVNNIFRQRVPCIDISTGKRV